MGKAFDPSRYLAAERAQRESVAASRDADCYANGDQELAEDCHSCEAIALKTAPVAAVAGVAGPLGHDLSWRVDLARFMAMPCPTGRSLSYWTRLQRDAAGFADQWGEAASRLGWTVSDMVGSPANPYSAAVDQLGLVPLLAGRPVVELHDDRAVIANRAGAANTFHRYPWRRPGVPIWLAYAMREGP